ncbi:MAG: Wzz/FepE/Etk N-terminal domain-containing protein, partial [Candidatus Korobacteraceae bacterium]
MTGGPPRGDISLAEMWAVVRKRKWLIAGCIGLALALAAGYCLKSPRRYEATARVVINPDSAVPLGIAGDEVNRAADPALIQETQVRIMQSDTVAWDVIRQLRLDENPDFLAVKSGEGTKPQEISPVRRFALMTEFHHRLKVASVPKTALVELRFR